MLVLVLVHSKAIDASPTHKRQRIPRIMIVVVVRKAAPDLYDIHPLKGIRMDIGNEIDEDCSEEWRAQDG